MRAIDGDALLEDFKNDRMNLFMDGLKGTPRERCISLNNVIERIEDAPTLSEEEIKEELIKIDKLVIPSADVELLQKYKKLGTLHMIDDNHCALIDTPDTTTYVDKKVSKVFQNMAYRSGVRELRDRLIQHLHTEMDLSKELTATDIHQLVWKIASECLSERSDSNVTESTEHDGVCINS